MTLSTSPTFPIRDRWNDRLIREVVVTGPADYTAGAGGEALDLDDLGLGVVFGIYGTLYDGTTVLIPWLDQPNQKVVWIDGDDGQEHATGDLSAFTGTLLITGR